ncbi:hypothetical protein REMIM1_CH02771 [Rhizobium etli bv. mimosae str. Mim1]|nr:hypothetical protein REMIM1_CH02771 [Rhizobium etli bv. mimosae str. Mim1]
MPPTNHGAEIMSIILTYFLVMVTSRRSYFRGLGKFANVIPDKSEISEPTESFQVLLMPRFSFDGDAIPDRRRSTPNLLLDVCHIKRLFL